tara:strand:+ start:92742 stop:92951 length:210 start_codon:yes stop_codon:yes gene_type:complete
MSTNPPNRADENSKSPVPRIVLWTGDFRFAWVVTAYRIGTDGPAELDRPIILGRSSMIERRGEALLAKI